MPADGEVALIPWAPDCESCPVVRTQVLVAVYRMRASLVVRAEFAIESGELSHLRGLRIAAALGFDLALPQMLRRCGRHWAPPSPPRETGLIASLARRHAPYHTPISLDTFSTMNAFVASVGLARRLIAYDDVVVGGREFRDATDGCVRQSCG